MQKHIHKLTLLFLTLCLVIAGAISSPSRASAAKIKLSKKSVTITKGKSVTLKLKGTKKKPKWSTSNKKIATVSKKGKVVGKKAGNAKITAKIGKKKYVCKVKVTKPKPVPRPVPEPTPQPIPSEPERPTYGDFSYWVDETGQVEKGAIVISKYNGQDKVATIPSMINGLPVRAIGAKAFSECTTLTEVKIPEGVTVIRQYAFWRCTNLVSINIPNSVTQIGSCVFVQCSSLRNIDIPANLTKILIYTFSGCTNLTKAVIPSSVTSIHPDAFEDCPNLTIYGYEGTHASSYASSNKIPFVDLAEDNEH